MTEPSWIHLAKSLSLCCLKSLFHSGCSVMSITCDTFHRGTHKSIHLIPSTLIFFCPLFSFQASNQPAKSFTLASVWVYKLTSGCLSLYTKWMSTGTAGTLTTARIPLSPRVPLGIELEYGDNPFLIVSIYEVIPPWVTFGFFHPPSARHGDAPPPDWVAVSLIWGDADGG